MADGIKWPTKIRVTNISTRDVLVTATRTETAGDVISEVPFTCGATWPVGMSKGDFLTSVGNSIWLKHLIATETADNLANFLADCESLLAAGLEAKEAE